MKNQITVTGRRFHVSYKDERTGGNIQDDTITMSKEQLRAAQLVGESSTELIYRIYNRKGYKVLEIGKPEKFSIALDLEELVKQYGGGAH